MRVQLDGTITVEVYGELGTIHAAGTPVQPLTLRNTVDVNVSTTAYVESLEDAKIYQQRASWYSSNGQIESVDIEIREI